MEDATQLCTRTFWWLVNRWVTLDTFRRLAKQGLAHVAPQVHAQCAASLEWARLSGDFARLFVSDGKLTPAEVAEKALDMTGGSATVAAKMADAQLASQNFAIDAACLVFAHTMLDTVAHDFCRIVARAALHDYEPFVAGRKAKMEDIKALPYDDLLARQVDDYLAWIEKESLLRKLDLLHKLCQPGDAFRKNCEHRYERDRVEQLDAIRHDVVHGRDVAAPLPHGDEDIEYMKRTSSYLLELVHHRYDVRIDPEYLKHVIPPAAP